MSDTERERLIRIACKDVVTRGHQISADLFGITSKAGIYQLRGRECCPLSAMMEGEKVCGRLSLTEAIARRLSTDTKWVCSFVCGFDDWALTKTKNVRGDPDAYSMGTRIAKEFA